MIKVTNSKLSQQDLLAVCQAYFKTMAKFVVDIERKTVAIGGEMHADAEAVLLENGSRQKDLWGGNIYPWNAPEKRLEYTSFINIRPMDDNMSMEIEDEFIKKNVREMIETLVLAPDEKMQESES